MDQKILFLDLDGTLLNDRKEITSGNRQAIDQALALGHRIVVTSGRPLKSSLEQGRRLGFRILQFNAVVEGNIHARHLYERLGFRQLGTIPGGFRQKDGTYVNICPYYRVL